MGCYLAKRGFRITFGSLVEVGLFEIPHYVLVSGEYLRALPSGRVARTIDRVVVMECMQKL